MSSGRTVRVGGDYNIVTGEGSTILLDTGPNVGTVRVTGNLIVEGDTLTVEAQNLNVEDNIITLNYGEPGPGVTVGDGYSGILIDRGVDGGSSQLPQPSFLWDESTGGWQLALGTSETGFNWSSSKLRLKEILTDADTDDGDLTVIGAGTGVIKVIGTINYEQQVTHDDDVPNKKYVDDAIQSNPTFQIVKDDTRVIALDVNNPLNPSAFVPPIGPYFGMPDQSEVSVLVNNRRIAAFRQNSIEFTGLTIFTEDPVVNDIAAAMAGNYNAGPIATNLTGFENQSAVVLQADNTNTNIRLETNGTGKVVISYAQSFEYLTPQGVSPPSAVALASVIYGDTPGSGTTGLRFVNTRPSKELDGTINASFTNDELISKNRALLFSMLF